jgi:hypothetical protein
MADSEEYRVQRPEQRLRNEVTKSCEAGAEVRRWRGKKAGGVETITLKEIQRYEKSESETFVT